MDSKLWLTVAFLCIFSISGLIVIDRLQSENEGLTSRLYDQELLSLSHFGTLNEQIRKLRSETKSSFQDANYKIAVKSEKIQLIEESLSPTNFRWAKIKKIRDAVKKTQEDFYLKDKLDSVGRTTYAAAVVDYTEKFDVPVSLILAMTRRESAFNPRAVSHAGAQGLIQIMPATAREIAADLGVRHYSMFKIRDNVKFGVYYIMKMLDEFDGDVALSVRAYNCGPTYVRRVVAQEYRDYPDETREYVKVILEGSENRKGFVKYYEDMGL